MAKRYEQPEAFPVGTEVSVTSNCFVSEWVGLRGTVVGAGDRGCIVVRCNDGAVRAFEADSLLKRTRPAPA